MRCFEEDVKACIAQLRLPVSRRRVVRTTNLLERRFGETRRRSKIAPALSGERPVLKLLYAAAIRAAAASRGLRITELKRRQLERLQAQLTETAKQENTPAVQTPSTPPRISSKQRTWPRLCVAARHSHQ